MVKSNKAITLIALVITIIVLLILAGVTVSMLTGENGIINKAKEAKEKTQQAEQAVAGTKDYYGRGWDNDISLIGYLNYQFVGRGGFCGSWEGAGVLYSDFTNGYARDSGGFRVVILS